MTLKIYPASSWRNRHYPVVVNKLRAIAEVYDWRQANRGFSWSCSTWQEYAQQLEIDPLAAAAFQRDKDALDRCDVLVLITPCGSSAHLEAAYASAAGKPVIVLFDATAPLQPSTDCELMLKLLAAGAGGVRYVADIPELLAALCSHGLAEQLARDEAEIMHRLLEAGYPELVDEIIDGEIDAPTAAQIFDGRRPAE
jgi:hypothetical protein